MPLFSAKAKQLILKTLPYFFPPKKKAFKKNSFLTSDLKQITYVFPSLKSRLLWHHLQPPQSDLSALERGQGLTLSSVFPSINTPGREHLQSCWGSWQLIWAVLSLMPHQHLSLHGCCSQMLAGNLPHWDFHTGECKDEEVKWRPKMTFFFFFFRNPFNCPSRNLNLIPALPPPLSWLF